MHSPTLALMTQLADAGLKCMGGFVVEPSDQLPLDSGTLLMIGPDEPRFWAIFKQSTQYLDGAPDPLDRWSKATLDTIADRSEGHALYPFGGPPYQPFYTWALRTGLSWASPIGFLVHDVAGLFASYRGALLVPWSVELPQARQSPCVSCADRPCLTACPTEAFSDGYNVAACKSHLQSPAGRGCMTHGCAARSACPIGQGLRIPEQANFHMKAFL